MLYPYLLKKYDDFTFEFITVSKITYQIYFLDNSFLFENYPHILSKVYSFNIEVLNGDPDNLPADERVGETIAHALKLFFSQVDNVVLYVCDSLDNRQFARKRKFDLWFYIYNDGSLIKEDGLVVIENTAIYNAILMHKKNKQIIELIFAFKELNTKANEK